jgi:hypothetical protein
MLWRFDDQTGYDTMRTGVAEDHSAFLKPVEESRIPIWRIDKQYRVEDAAYDALPVEGDDRTDYLTANEAYRKDRRRREGYEAGIPSSQIENHVVFYEETEAGFRRERFLAAEAAKGKGNYYTDVYLNPDYWPKPHAKVPFLNRPFDLVPDVKYDEIREKWSEQLKTLLDDIPTIVGRIGNLDDRARMRERLEAKLFNDPKNKGFYEDFLRLLAYDEFRPGPLKEAVAKAGVPMPNLQMLVKDDIGYQALKDKGVPDGWDKWWEDDRYLMEHLDYYKIKKALRGWSDRDFDSVPTASFERLYNEQFINLRHPDGKADREARKAFRARNRIFDTEGARIGLWKPLTLVERGERVRAVRGFVKRFAG